MLSMYGQRLTRQRSLFLSQKSHNALHASHSWQKMKRRRAAPARTVAVVCTASLKSRPHKKTIALRQHRQNTVWGGNLWGRLGQHGSCGTLRKHFTKPFPQVAAPPLHKVSFSHPPPVTKSLCPAASSSARSLELGLVLPGFHCGKVNLGQNRLGRYFIIGLSEPWPGWSLVQSYK